MTAFDTESLLRETLDRLARDVGVSPEAYRRTQREWRRRERRRRITLVILATIAIGAADGVGLWALRTSADAPIVYDRPAPAGP
jgi:hypothetical protein